MPKDTIERACKRGSGELGAENYNEVRYEGYGRGVAIIIDTATDNVNRTVSEVRHALSKHGGNMGTSGSVSYMFNKLGVLSYAPESMKTNSWTPPSKLVQMMWSWRMMVRLKY